MKILHLKHNEIDKAKWDAVISHSNSDIPYSYSWWLDVVSPKWEALISEDYEYIMPLPLKIQYGIRYLVHPVWTQQLGIFSQKVVSPEIFNQFRKKIPYLIYDFNINYTNWNPSIEKKTNLIIPYDEKIDNIRKHYNTNTRRNINKSCRFDLNIDSVEPSQFIELWKKENRDKKCLLVDKIEPLIETAIDNQSELLKIHLLGVYEQDTLIAALFGIQTKSRFIYLIPVSNKRGKQCCAMFKLVDFILENICCKNQLNFDCEGSMIIGVARFYHGLGAIEQPYGVIKRCYPIKLINFIHRFI